MGIPVSLFLIAVGLVLALAVNPTSPSVDVNAVGWILFAVGAFGMLLTLFLWDSWAGRGFWHRETYARRTNSHHAQRVRRRTVVEENDVPPPAPPPY
jgi:hypothetical protein